MESSGFNISLGTRTGHRPSKPHLIYESRNGFCRIYSVEADGRRIALKALKPEFADSEVHIDLLRKEYEIGVALYHAGIASTLGFQSFEGIGQAIIMEYVDGITLRDYIDRHGSVSKKEAMSIIEQICNALSYLHSHQLIHRDLKPSNIMLTHAGHYVKLIDFGLSDGTAFTDFKYAGGTRHYSAPEQLETGTDNDPRADIFSLGVIMREICPKAGGGYRSTARRCSMENPELRPSDISKIIPLIHSHDKAKKLWLTLSAAVVALGATWFAISFGENRITQTSEAASSAAIKEADTTSTFAPLTTPVDSIEITAVGSGVGDATPGIPADMATTSPESEPASTSIAITLNDAALKCQELIKHHYANHLKLIDTLTTSRSSELASAGYWKYLTKQDFKKWLADNGITNQTPGYEIYTSMTQKAIDDYEQRNFYDELRHWQKAAYPQTAKVYSKKLDDDRVYTITLNEDGTYTEEITDVRAKQIREQMQREQELIKSRGY